MPIQTQAAKLARIYIVRAVSNLIRKTENEHRYKMDRIGVLIARTHGVGVVSKYSFRFTRAAGMKVRFTPIADRYEIAYVNA